MSIDDNHNKTNISNVRKNNFKQIFAALVTSSLHLICGSTLAFSSIAVPQILEEQNYTSTNTTVLPNEMLWISSAAALMMPISCVLSAFTTDTLGRLNTLQLSAVPNLIGWTLIATAKTNALIAIGRLSTGFSFGFSTCSAYVYVAEISDPKIRGVLLSLSGLFVAFGILLTYFEGWLMNWRYVAWISLVYSLTPVIMIFLLPESPLWLISKGRQSQARLSLKWLEKHEKPAEVNQELMDVIDKSTQRIKSPAKINLKDFLQPTCYKPFIIIFIIFALQQFSGIFILTFNSVIFFKDVGIKIDPYQTSIYIGIIRFIVAVFGIWLTKWFGRRPLMIVSAAGMACCMAISGIFTNWIHNGTTTHYWVPTCMVMLYFCFSSMGLQSLPFSISSEMFPQRLRGVMQNVSLFMCYSMMFVSLQSYNVLVSAFNGSAGLQYFFSVISLVTVIFIHLFLPETFRKKLSDIEEYFWHHTLYVY